MARLSDGPPAPCRPGPGASGASKAANVHPWLDLAPKRGQYPPLRARRMMVHSRSHPPPREAETEISCHEEKDVPERRRRRDGFGWILVGCSGENTRRR